MLSEISRAFQCTAVSTDEITERQDTHRIKRRSTRDHNRAHSAERKRRPCKRDNEIVKRENMRKVSYS